MNKISDKLMVGISTRDRWQALLKTLSIVREFFGRDLKIVVTIDGGEVPPEWRTRFDAFDPVIIESKQRMGYIFHRNRMAYEADVPYYLSLDDDSYPLLGDITSAIDYLENNAEVGVLAFGIRYLSGDWQIPTTAESPYQVAGFVGCAHILRVSTFKMLGGYDETLIHQGEESHYTSLMLKRGYRCMHFPGPVFIHEFSLIGRSFHRMWYYSARNKILWAYDFSPNHYYFVIKLIRGIAEQTLKAFSERSMARVSGLWSALVTIGASGRRRHPLSIDQYRLWHSLFR